MCWAFGVTSAATGCERYGHHSTGQSAEPTRVLIEDSRAPAAPDAFNRHVFGARHALERMDCAPASIVANQWPERSVLGVAPKDVRLCWRGRDWKMLITVIVAAGPERAVVKGG